jgi:hypothetical protein
MSASQPDSSSSNSNSSPEPQQQPKVGNPDEVEPQPDNYVREAAEESAEKGLPYETPRPKSVEPS